MSGSMERCTRWSGRLKPGGLETLRSTSLAEQEHPIKWLGVFDGPPPQGHIGAGYFVQIQTTQLSKNKMEYFMGKIFGDCFEDLEPMRSPHNAFCEREPAFLCNPNEAPTSCSRWWGVRPVRGMAASA